MKSVFSRSVLGRRVAAVAAVGLAASALSLGVAGSASAANTIELQGTVTGAGGVALENVEVNAYDSTSGDFIETVTTDATGHYEFTDDAVVGKVKVQFDPESFPSTANDAASPVTATSPLPYQTRWSGGSRYKAGAVATPTLTVDPSTAPTVNASLPQYAAITGNITVAEGHVATNSFGGWAMDSDENYAVWDDFSDNATGNYRIIVDPRSALRVGGYGDDLNVSYLYQYWKNADRVADATPISIAPGQTVGGINFRLTSALTARQAPHIVGYPTVGLPLTADAGTWSRTAGTEYSFSWLRNGVVVGSGTTYTPTVADYHQKLTLVVTALNETFTGQGTAVTSDVVKYGASERVGAKAKAGRKVALAVKLVSAKQKPVKGKVVVLRGTKVVHAAVKLVKGKAVIVLKNQPKGHQTYTVHYKGNKVLAQVDKTVTVRVHS